MARIILIKFLVITNAKQCKFISKSYSILYSKKKKKYFKRKTAYINKKSF